MSRVLVTGGNGFIGQHVVKAALKRGHDVVSLVRKPTGDRSESNDLVDRAATVAEGDIRDLISLQRAMSQCDAVIHTAALYSFKRSDAAPMYEVNVRGTENVIRAAIKANVDRIVYTGTVGTTAFKEDDLATEADVAEPSSMHGPYKRSKFEAERIVRRYAQQGIPIITVCPTAPIGPGDAKPTPTGQFIVDFMRGRLPGYVNTGLNFVHVSDVAEGHLLAMENGQRGRRYLPGNKNGNLTLAQALHQLAVIVARPAPRLRIPTAVALAAAYVDNLIEGLALGKEPRIPLEGVRMASRRMWVDPSWSVRALQLPQTPVDQAFQDAVTWFSNGNRYA